MSLASGARLGSYEVIGPLGAGGMGEVYRGRDTRLKREVAIKVLPEALAEDPDALARFRREAELLATLNHPNIATIHGLEESDGTIAIVMELVEGETLADKIVGTGLGTPGTPRPVPLADALAIARQIADALEAAHEKGVVHRDLKPANIKITPDGNVKVLDFGLAKSMGTGVGRAGDGSRGDRGHRDPSPGSSISPTLTMSTPFGGAPGGTFEGMILGTPGYMSPEQARGKPVDRRADIWAFGCILFEMLTGTATFATGETVSDAIAAILTREPDWTALPADVPAHVRSLLRRCLQKDVKKRLRDIGDVRFEMDEDAAGAAAAPAPVIVAAPARPVWHFAIAAIVIALVAAAIGAVGVGRFAAPARVPDVTRLSFALGDGERLSRPAHQSVAISPDGTQVVYVANGRLYLRAMSALEARPIPGTDSFAENPAFSPDGRSIVYGSRTDGALKRVAVTGGAAVTICPAGAVLGLSWAHDGSILFGQEQGAKGILRVSANGGTPEVVVAVKGREDAHGPQLLPDGEHVLFTLATGTGASRWDTAQIVVQSLKTGERRTLVNGGADGRYLATGLGSPQRAGREGGHIVYGLSGVLYAVPFDARRLALTGEPVPVVEGVRASGALSGSMQFGVSDTGTLVYIPGRAAPVSDQRELGLLDRKGAVERLKLPAGAYANPRVSPDGKRLAVALEDGKGSDVWIYDLSGASPIRRLTFTGRNHLPIWSPDSRRIAFQSDRETDEAIFAQLADGSGTAERLTKPDQGTSHSPESWSPDGAQILFSATRGSTIAVWTLSLADRKTAPFGGVQSSEPTNAAFSPDGRWVAYSSTEGGRRLLVQPFPATGAKYEIAPQGTQPIWSPDGKGLIWPGDGGFQIVSVTTRPSFTVSNPVESRTGGLQMIGPSAQRTYDVTPDGRFLGTIATGSNATLVPASVKFEVVLDWFEELKAKAATR